MFIQIVEGQSENGPRIRDEWLRWSRDVAPKSFGLLGATAGLSSDGHFIALLRFESEESAYINSDRPEQIALWRAVSNYFLGKPVFRACAGVRAFLHGSWQDANLVRVSHGNARDLRRVVANFELRAGDRLAWKQELIGGILVWEREGFVTEALYFRLKQYEGGDVLEPSRTTSRVHRDAALLVQDRTSFDLIDPWTVLVLEASTPSENS